MYKLHNSHKNARSRSEGSFTGQPMKCPVCGVTRNSPKASKPCAKAVA